jgi:hypothetical protein
MVLVFDIQEEIHRQRTFRLSRNLVPWRAYSAGGIDHWLYGEIPASIRPAGRYDAYVLVTPAGTLADHYLWSTYFEIP